MTVQINDNLWYNGEKFVLIDCEKGKNIIDCANFEMEKTNIHCTACRRGYFAEYFIGENNILYGRKLIYRLTRKKIRLMVSPKLKINYTGSAVIAINKNGLGFSELLSFYLDYDRAFGLYFVGGELVEVTNLAPAIKEWQDFKKTKDLEQETYSEKCYKYYMGKPGYQDEFAQKHLKYRYNKTLNARP